jgi:histidinol-phosphate aminotransferase
MVDLAPVHGGSDAGPEPRFDFSSNANPVGPCPSALAAVRAADVTKYPDPEYTQLRQRLAAHHGAPPARIVVGAGASELTLRLIRNTRGSVHVLGPTFSEYTRCARVDGRTVHQAETPAEFLNLRRTRRGLGFICWPNNPTGATWSLDFVAEAARIGSLVVDLSYAPLCPDGDLARVEAAAASAIKLYSPGKSYGLTGLRAGYAITPEPVRELAWQAPAWVLDKPGEAFLTATLEPRASRWLAAARPRYTRWRCDLAQALESRGYDVKESPATYLLVRVGAARALTAALRAHGIRVRDATSFGLPEWIRLSGQPPKARAFLLARLDALRTDQDSTRFAHPENS